MLRLTIDCTAPDGSIQGVKEVIAMALERWGDCRLVRVDEIPDQIKMEEVNYGQEGEASHRA